jgi:hypothetical protein
VVGGGVGVAVGVTVEIAVGVGAGVAVGVEPALGAAAGPLPAGAGSPRHESAAAARPARIDVRTLRGNLARTADSRPVAPGGLLIRRACRDVPVPFPEWGAEPAGHGTGADHQPACFLLYSAMLLLRSRYSSHEKKQSLSSARRCSSAFARFPTMR